MTVDTDFSDLSPQSIGTDPVSQSSSAEESLAKKIGEVVLKVFLSLFYPLLAIPFAFAFECDIIDMTPNRYFDEWFKIFGLNEPVKPQLPIEPSKNLSETRDPEPEKNKEILHIETTEEKTPLILEEIQGKTVEAQKTFAEAIKKLDWTKQENFLSFLKGMIDFYVLKAKAEILSGKREKLLLNLGEKNEKFLFFQGPEMVLRYLLGISGTRDRNKETIEPISLESAGIRSFSTESFRTREISYQVSSLNPALVAFANKVVAAHAMKLLIGDIKRAQTDSTYSLDDWMPKN